MNKQDEVLFDLFVETLINNNELDFLLDRIPYKVKGDAMSDYSEGVL